MTDGSVACNTSPVKKQDFLLDSEISLHRYTDWCPTAQTMEAWSETLQNFVIFPLKCKRWGCRHCGQRKMSSLAMKTRNAKPNRLITLTVWNKLFENPREAFDRTRRLIPVLIRKIRNKFGEFEYLRILEVTKKGWPHYHHVVRSKYIPQRWLADSWAEISGAKIVDVRQIKKTKDVFYYVIKYLAKQKYIPWTTRRCSWSKNFFVKEDKLDSVSLDLIGMKRIDQHPYHYINQNLRHCYFGRFSRDLLCYSSVMKEIQIREDLTPVRLADPVRKETGENEIGDYDGKWRSDF